MLSSNMHNQNVRVSFPPFQKVRFTVQERHPSLPCADPAVQSQLGTTTGHGKGNHMERSSLYWSSIFHSKSKVPNWQQGSISRSASKAALPTLPRVRSRTSTFLEIEGCQILSLLQYKQAASWATRIRHRISYWLEFGFLSLAPSHSPDRGNSGSPILLPPNWRQHLPQSIQHCHIWMSTSAAKSQ